MESKRVININYEAVCNKCNGKGNSLFGACGTCGGTGYVQIKKEVHITVCPSPDRPQLFELSKEIDFNKL